MENIEAIIFLMFFSQKILHPLPTPQEKKIKTIKKGLKSKELLQ